MLVDVNCDDGTVQIARIIKDGDDTCTVRFLERIKSNLYEFMKSDDVVEKSSISGFYDTDDLEKTLLYTKVHNGYELIDDSEDEDFTCSESEDEDETDDDDISLVDEDET
jgi:hypothetical protein